MERVLRLRRVALLCCYFVKNYAYYKAGWNGKTSKAKNDFWITVQSNFIDVATLEWMKLFGDYNNDKHHWRNIVDDGNLFKANMLKYCNLSDDEFCCYRQKIKDYRDSFVGHLDSALRMRIPCFADGLALTYYYYNYILGKLKKSEVKNLPENIEEYYQQYFEESEQYL